MYFMQYTLQGWSLAETIVFPKCLVVKNSWIDATQRGDDWYPASHSVICSRHFTIDCFYLIKNNKHRLISTAVPTLFLPLLIREDSTLVADSPFTTHSPLPRTSIPPDEIVKKNLPIDEERKSIIDEVLKAIKDEDEFDGIGMIVASKLRRMDEDQRIYAELLLNKILIQGIKKGLQEETDLTGLKYT